MELTMSKSKIKWFNQAVLSRLVGFPLKRYTLTDKLRFNGHDNIDCMTVRMTVLYNPLHTEITAATLRKSQAIHHGEAVRLDFDHMRLEFREIIRQDIPRYAVNFVRAINYGINQRYFRAYILPRYYLFRKHERELANVVDDISQHGPIILVTTENIVYNEPRIFPVNLPLDINMLNMPAIVKCMEELGNQTILQRKHRVLETLKELATVMKTSLYIQGKLGIFLYEGDSHVLENGYLYDTNLSFEFRALGEQPVVVNYKQDPFIRSPGVIEVYEVPYGKLDTLDKMLRYRV